MKKDTIYSFKSLLVIKDKNNFSINCGFYKKYKIIKIQNTSYLKDRFTFPITKFLKKAYRLKTMNSMAKHRLPVLVNHEVFVFYINKYKFTNKYLIENIREFYRLTKAFVYIFNEKYIKDPSLEIEINHDVVFNILKYNELKLDDVEKYKKEKVENVFTEDLFETIRRL